MKRIFKRILIILTATIVLCVGILYYLSTYRFKESLRYAIKMQTNGRYVFDAGSAEVFPWKRAIRLKDSYIRCIDPKDYSATYDVKIPELYFSLASWKNVLLERKMIVDSMAFILPAVKMNIHRKPAVDTSREAFRATDILNILEKTLTHFNAHAFSLRGASYEYSVRDTLVLRVNDINLYLKNFTGVNNEDDHLLGSERVVFSLGRQHWVLPKRKQALGFSSLRFDSKGQRLEIDSLNYREQDSAGIPGMHLRTEKIFFNSRHLPAVYQQDRLLIDTLTCLNPVLTIPPGKHGNTGHDTSMALNRIPFGFVQIGFINVVNADVHLRGRQAASRSSNLRIYNLRLDPKAQRPLSIDSVRMDLRQMVFFSRDSLYQMNIDEFTIQKDGILFTGVTYVPTEKNHADKTVSAKAPALKLKNVDLEALMRKHLKADEAELLNPVITLHRRAGKPPLAARPANPSAKNLDIFYETLHGIREMVNVEHFWLRNGQMGYNAGGAKGTALDVKQINAHILLNKLFLSDSLVDIKHSIPDMRIGSLDLSARGIQIKSRGFRFDGVARRNWIGSTEVSLANGTRLLAKDVYWEVFDWDVFQKTRNIQVNYFRAGSVAVELKKNDTAGSRKSQHGLPVIRIGRLEAEKFSFSQASKNGMTTVAGGGLMMEQLRSDKHLFLWKDMQLELSAVKIQKPGFLLETGAGKIFNGKESTVKAIRFSNSSTKAAVPELRFQLPLRSTDLSSIHFSKLLVNRSEVTVQADKKPAAAKTSPNIQLPFSLQVDRLELNTALNYTSIGEKDTLRLQTTVMVNMNDVHGGRDGIRFQPAKIALQKSRIEQLPLTAEVRSVLFELSGGSLGVQNKLQLKHAQWSGGKFSFRKDSTQITGENLQGKIPSAAIVINPNEPFDWRSLVPGLEMGGEKIHFSNNKMNAGADVFEWCNQNLVLGNIFMLPRLSREETFKHEKWQQDYITVEGGQMSISGFDPSRIGGALLHIPRIGFTGLKMTVSRDKHMPLQHGIEKEMPTKLVSKITMPLKVDTAVISGSTIVYAERPAKADRWNEIPITGVEGLILNLGNRFSGNDSMLVFASGNVFNGNIQRLVYRESYADSLSGFTASLHVSPADLPELAGRAMPHGNVKITKGKIDTIASHWEGNKYAAFGQMQFYYHDLRLRIGDKRHPDKWRPMPALKTWLANLVLPSRVSRPSFIFTERNQEKFIFNYWIIVQKSGVMSSMGLKRNRAYRKKYNKYRQQYSLPPLTAMY